MPNPCFSYPAEVPRRMPGGTCFSYQAGVPRAMPNSICFSYPRAVPPDIRNRDTRAGRTRRETAGFVSSACFSYPVVPCFAPNGFALRTAPSRGSPRHRAYPLGRWDGIHCRFRERTARSARGGVSRFSYGVPE